MAAPLPTGSRLENPATIALFACALLAPTADAILALDPSPPLEENRPLAASPPRTLALSDPGLFSAGLESHIRDTFGFRRSLVRLRNLAVVRGLGSSPVPEIVLGQDGWMFFAGDNSAVDLAGGLRYAPAELDRWRRGLLDRKEGLAARGIRYLYLVAPNGMSVYPEFLPWRAVPSRPGRARLDQLAGSLSGIRCFLDVRPHLRRARLEHPAFYKTDTHWNEWGSFAAYRAAMGRLSEEDPTLAPLPVDAFPPLGPVAMNGDLVRLLDLPGDRREISVGFAGHAKVIYPLIEPIRQAGREKPSERRVAFTFPGSGRAGKVLLYGDSYSAWLVPFMQRHFETVTLVAYRHSDDPFETWIDRTSPDVVIEECAERLLGAGPAR